MLPVNRHNQPVNVPPLLENSLVDGLLTVGTFIDETIYAVSGDRHLTTVHVDTPAMGRAAVHLLSLRLEKPDAARLTITVHSELIQRESTMKK